MMNDPQQELFSELLVQLRENLDCEVYDGKLPPDGTPYPFVYVSDSYSQDTQMKGCVTCQVLQTVHVFSKRLTERGDFSRICYQVKQVARKIRRTQNYGISVMSLNQRIIPDDTTDTPLLHANIQIRYYCS